MAQKLSAAETAGRRWRMYPTRLGVDVYNKLSLTGLTRSAINDLVAIATSDLINDGEEPLPIDPEALCRRILYQGSIVIQIPEGIPEFVDDVYAPSPRLFLQFLRDDTGAMTLIVPQDDMSRAYTKLVREYRLEGGVWQERLVQDYGLGNRAKEIEPAAGEQLDKINEAGLVVVPNDRGLLYWAQHIINAIEEIAATMRSVMTGVNLLPIVSGNVGTADEVAAAVRQAINMIVFPGDVSVDRVISNAVINQLIDESHERRSDFYDALGVVEKDTPNRPVAADREQRSKAMLALVRGLRGKVIEIMSRLGREISFEPYVAKSAEERVRELDILERIKGELTTDEFSSRTRALVGLGPRRDNPAR